MKFRIQDEDLGHATIILVGWVLCIFWNNTSILSLFGILAFLLFSVRNRDVFKAIRPFGGYANWVTLGRLALLLSLGFLHDQFTSNQLLIIAIIVLSFDGIDGLVARKFNMSSEFGGKLDGETDAFFVLLLSTINYHHGYLGAWILWAGLLRYLFVIACFIIWSRILPEPVSYLRKTIAVVIMGALLLPLFFTNAFITPIVGVAVAAVTASFAKSISFQIRENR